MEIYNDNVPSSCRDWFRCFRNGDLDVKDKKRFGARRKFEIEGLESLFDEESC